MRTKCESCSIEIFPTRNKNGEVRATNRKYCSRHCNRKNYQNKYRESHREQLVLARKLRRGLQILKDPVGAYSKWAKQAREYREKNREYFRTYNREKNGSGVKADDIKFYNYKEPLKKVPEGYGYLGTLAYSKKLDQVQCHICGLFFRFINNAHLGKCHKMTARQYKEKFQLSPTTALCGEGTRVKLIKRFDNMSPEYWEQKRKDLKKAQKVPKRHPKYSLEVHNKRGTCPDQLLDKIKKLANILHRAPTGQEFTDYYKKFMGSIQYTFGTYENALRKAGLTPGREVQAEKYSEENLLEYLRIFYREHNRVPVSSDFSRGLLPKEGVYYKKFGSMLIAREVAGIPISPYLNLKY